MDGSAERGVVVATKSANHVKTVIILIRILQVQALLGIGCKARDSYWQLERYKTAGVILPVLRILQLLATLHLASRSEELCTMHESKSHQVQVPSYRDIL